MKRWLLAFPLMCLGLTLTAAVCGTADRDTDTPAIGAEAHLQEPDDDADDASGNGQARKVALLADEFGVSAAEIEAHRANGIGWGALFKLYALARAKGVSVDELLAQSTLDANGEREFNFGEMIQSLTAEQRAAFDDGPKNLGQLISSANKAKAKATPAP